jgi:cob(I)alamin adenosyltransferase
VTRIYTRKGDDGTTSLWYGGRVAKTDARTEAYGSIDEAGAALGVARSQCGPDQDELAADILRLQRELFVAGAELATATWSPRSSRSSTDTWTAWTCHRSS